MSNFGTLGNVIINVQKVCFVSSISSNDIFRTRFHKKKTIKSSNFWQKSCLNPFKKRRTLGLQKIEIFP